MADFELTDDIRDDTRAAWRRYLDSLVPFRPELHRYCRRLTGNVWDAEDLVQETLLRGFATLGSVHRTVGNPRGYLIRIATNLWIDSLRRREAEADAVAEQAIEASGAAPSIAPAADVRDAGVELMRRLSPQERAAVVLKEVFEMSLEEIAAVLGTTVGAIKAALHRARARLRGPLEAPASRRPPSPALVDRFVERLNASDMPGLLALMLDTGSVEMLGAVVEVGREQFHREKGWFWQAVHVHPDLPPEIRPQKFVNERATFAGEPVMLSFSMHGGRKLLEAVARLEEEDGRIARLRAYNFCPETVSEVGAALGLPVGAGSYTLPTSTRR